MKKLLTLSSIFLISSLAVAQNTPTQNGHRKSVITKPSIDLDDQTRNRKMTAMPSSKGKVAAPIWSEDFSSAGMNLTTSNGTWIAGGLNSNLVAWDDDGPDNLLANGWTPLPSPTAGNGFAIFDFYNNFPDPGGFATSPVEGTLTSPVINLGQDSVVFVSFYQQLYYCCHLEWNAWLEVSSDGGNTFTHQYNVSPFERNARHWLLGMGYKWEIDISEGVKADPTNVVLRFNWTSTTPDANGQYSTAYFWMIDDIEISELPKNQLKFTTYREAPAHDIIYNNDGLSGKTGFTAIDQVTPISFDSNVENFGQNDQTNVELIVTVYDAGNNLVDSLASAAIGTLNSKDTGTYQTLTTPTWTPTNTGTYTFIYAAISDSISWMQTERDTFTLYIEDSLTSLDFNIFSNSMGTTQLGDDNSAIATRIYLPSDGNGDNDVDVFGLDVRFSTLTAEGGDVVVDVYDTLGFDLINGFGSASLFNRSYNVDASFPGQVKRLDMTTSGQPLAIPTGTYYFVITMFSNGGQDTIRIGNNQTFDQPGFASVMYDVGDGRWYTGYNNSLTFNAPMIRVVSGNYTIGLNENEAVSMSVFPNPTSGEVKIQISQGGQYEFELVNLLGQVVRKGHFAVNGSESIRRDLSDLDRGVYILNVRGDNFDESTKLTIH